MLGNVNEFMFMSVVSHALLGMAIKLYVIFKCRNIYQTLKKTVLFLMQ